MNEQPKKRVYRKKFKMDKSDPEWDITIGIRDPYKEYILVQSTKHTEVYEHAFVSKKERTSKIDEIKTRLSSDYRL